VVDEVHEVTEEKLGLFGRINLFYRQVISELKKVVWPTREQLTTYLYSGCNCFRGLHHRGCLIN